MSKLWHRSIFSTFGEFYNAKAVALLPYFAFCPIAISMHLCIACFDDVTKSNDRSVLRKYLLFGSLKGGMKCRIDLPSRTFMVNLRCFLIVGWV